MPQPLSELVGVLCGRSLGKRDREPSDSGTPVTTVKVRDIAGGRVAAVGELGVSFVDPTRMPKVRLEVGDILLAAAGEEPRVAGVTEEHAGVAPSLHVAVLRPKSEDAGRRVLDFLASGSGQALPRSFQAGKVASTISTKALRELAIP